MLFLTTTAIDVDEELVNRCLVLTINESREQTRAIQQRQRARRTLAGFIAQSEAEALHRLHQGLAAFVVRYLEWLRVHNYSASTIENREVYLGYFVIWCTE